MFTVSHTAIVSKLKRTYKWLRGFKSSETYSLNIVSVSQRQQHSCCRRHIHCVVFTVQLYNGYFKPTSRKWRFTRSFRFKLKSHFCLCVCVCIYSESESFSLSLSHLPFWFFFSFFFSMEENRKLAFESKIKV